MFGTLFVKECKQMMRSLIYIIYLLIMIVFLIGQLGSHSLYLFHTEGNLAATQP